MAISNKQVIAYEISRKAFNKKKYLDFFTKNIARRAYMSQRDYRIISWENNITG